ncbi:MAG: hypothetical protein R3234_13255, partial [Thermoanaerobaculia bacterium]|nr:hypothetical protein [Thermoanaerobaculia bacterium]
MTKHLRIPILVTALIHLPFGAGAQGPPCLPCAGITVGSPASVAQALEEAPALEEGARLYVRWRHVLDSGDPPFPASGLVEAGATPWIELVFRTPSPILENVETLETELSAAAEIVRNERTVDHFQVRWKELSGAGSLEEYAFLSPRSVRSAPRRRTPPRANEARMSRMPSPQADDRAPPPPERWRRSLREAVR